MTADSVFMDNLVGVGSGLLFFRPVATGTERCFARDVELGRSTPFPAPQSGPGGLPFDDVALIRIPNTLRASMGGSATLVVDAADLAGVVDELERRHPGVAARLLAAEGRLHGFVNVFVDGDECRTLAGLHTPVEPETTVSIVPAVAGG